MEPQNNFSGYTGGPQQPQQQVYGKKKSGSGCGKFAIIGTIVLLLVVAGGAYLIYYAINKAKDVGQEFMQKFPDSKNNQNVKDLKPADSRFKGDIIDAVIIPTAEGNARLWILTDASSIYYTKTKSPGKFSMGVSCNDCKTISYTFDPSKGEVNKSVERPFQNLVSESNYLIVKGNVMQITRGRDNEAPTLVTYNGETMEQISDTKDFIDKHPELSPGINQVHIHKDDNYVGFEMKDGQNEKFYSPITDKVYASEREMLEGIASNAGNETMTLIMTQSDTKDKRESLYRITAPASVFIKRGLIIHSHFSNAALSNFNYDKEIKTEKLSEKMYLLGTILYCDDDYAVVAYVDQIGKNVSTMISCVDAKNGKELWTLGPDQLFATMKEQEKFDKSDTQKLVTIRRFKDLITIQSKGYGIMGIDANSGKKLWEYFMYSK